MHYINYFRSGFNAIGSILVRPFDWGSGLIVKADVAHDLAVQILEGSEDAAGNNSSLDFGEPDLDLVKPG